MDALDYNPIEDDAGVEETVEDVVARIKARGPGQLPPPPSREVIQRLVAHVADETPMTREEEIAWNRTWLSILDEMHRRDR